MPSLRTSEQPGCSSRLFTRSKSPRARRPPQCWRLDLTADVWVKLTPATSASLLPLVKEAGGNGLIAAAWASVKGSKFAAEVSLHVSKAEEVVDSWPSGSDALPTLTSKRQVPPAFQREVALQSAPKGGLPRWQIWVGVVAILFVTAIPGVGPETRAAHDRRPGLLDYPGNVSSRRAPLSGRLPRRNPARLALSAGTIFLLFGRPGSVAAVTLGLICDGDGQVDQSGEELSDVTALGAQRR